MAEPGITSPLPSTDPIQKYAVPPTRKKRKAKLVAVVHEEGCTGCEVCIEFCPVDCIYKVPGPENPEEHGYVSVNGVCVVDEEVCIGCKLCAKYCPWEVIDMVTREAPEIVPA
jgi:formate hydrogenlyase subunit 6/NADH:ubiquinone oxidoreductase subunit I